MFDMMLLARAVDERQWILNRSGREAFHIFVPGTKDQVWQRLRPQARPRHHGAYYRSLAAVLAFGIDAAADIPVGSGPRRMIRRAVVDRCRRTMAWRRAILTSGSPGRDARFRMQRAPRSPARPWRDGGVSIVYFGDGASSKGDFP